MADERIVPKLAALARLELGEGEVERLERELQTILHHVARLQEVSLEGVVASYWTVGSGEAMRPDEPGLSLDVEEGLGGAAARDGRYLVVPSVREDD